jgi:hypothetical protein
LESEFRDLSDLNSREHVTATLGFFSRAPQSSNLARVFPDDVELRELVTEIHIENGILTATISELYEEMSPIDEVLFRSAFTLTMIGLPRIESVRFLSSSGDEWIESADTIANNPLISPARRTAYEFILFFVDETGEGLITVLYESADVDVHRRAQNILELLIEGQNEPGIMPLIPPDTRVREVMIEDELGIYINLSPDFHRGFNGNSTQARLMLQSIAHTMLENHKALLRRHVFFLIDSERLEDFHGISGFDLSFTYDETIMLGYVPPEENEE